MNKIDQRIIKFIHKHHVLTLATSKKDIPYCANCFYVYDEEENILIFTSGYETKHIKDVLKQNIVAGSIVLETNVIGKIQGVQFQGKISEPKGDVLNKVKIKYLKRFPVAMLMKTTLWVVELTFLKFTDNRLGFGKKLFWGQEESKKNIKL
ncbi:MAG TPA: pyridoxamine 5'-phosphate oxidase family protein [Bacteroidales bacterium]|nr:pyridoxamine 5'-phosphate oxidase family protein [Bacteroidales bacterium]